MGGDVRAQAGIGLVGVGTLSASVSVRAYFSPQHLWAAEHFARLAADFERDHIGGEARIYLQHRSYVVAAVMESVAFLEAFINEIYQDAAEGTTGATGGLSPEAVRHLAGYWVDHGRDGALVKYRMARLLIAGERTDEGRSPHDDVRYLIKLRNWLIHYQPRWVGDESPETVIDHMRGRFPENPFLGNRGAAWFPNHALSAGCAAWAVRSAAAFVDEFVTAIGSTRSHHRLQHDEQP